MYAWLGYSVAILTLLGALCTAKSTLLGRRDSDAGAARAGAVMLLLALLLQVRALFRGPYVEDLGPASLGSALFALPWFLLPAPLTWLMRRLEDDSALERFLECTLALLLGGEGSPWERRLNGTWERLRRQSAANVPEEGGQSVSTNQAENEQPDRSIQVGNYRGKLQEILAAAGLPSCELLIVDSIQAWAQSVGLEETNPDRVARIDRRPDGRPVVVIRSVVTDAHRLGVTGGMEFRGVEGEKIRRLADLEAFVEHTMLHEAAHWILGGDAREQACDEWAFEQLSGRLGGGGASA